MPEGDTILWAATRIRPVLEGRVPEAIDMPAGRVGGPRGPEAHSRWPAQLAGRAVTRIETRGKNLLLHFEGELVLRSHLRMTGSWGVYGPGQRWRRPRPRAWIVFEHGGSEVVQFDGPVLELLTESRARTYRPLTELGPDILADEFDEALFLTRLRRGDPSRPIGEALLDQRTLAGIGNIWKSEGCWEARVDPWREVGTVTDGEALAIVGGARPRMLHSGLEGPRAVAPRVYRLHHRPCGRCGTQILARHQGDANRVTYWCPGCQI